MRKKYVKPLICSEEFVPNEYVSLCADGLCNISGYVFYDNNSDGVPDGEEPFRRNVACNEPYVIRDSTSQTLPATNCVVAKRRRNDNGTPLWLPDDYWEYYDYVKAWNYKETHTTTELTVDPKRPNHS